MAGRGRPARPLPGLSSRPPQALPPARGAAGGAGGTVPHTAAEGGGAAAAAVSRTPGGAAGAVLLARRFKSAFTASPVSSSLLNQPPPEELLNCIIADADGRKRFRIDGLAPGQGSFGKGMFGTDRFPDTPFAAAAQCLGEGEAQGPVLRAVVALHESFRASDQRRDAEDGAAAAAPNPGDATSMRDAAAVRLLSELASWMKVGGARDRKAQEASSKPATSTTPLARAFADTGVSPSTWPPDVPKPTTDGERARALIFQHVQRRLQRGGWDPQAARFRAPAVQYIERAFLEFATCIKKSRAGTPQSRPTRPVFIKMFHRKCGEKGSALLKGVVAELNWTYDAIGDELLDHSNIAQPRHVLFDSRVFSASGEDMKRHVTVVVSDLADGGCDLLGLVDEMGRARVKMPVWHFPMSAPYVPLEAMMKMNPDVRLDYHVDRALNERRAQVEVWCFRAGDMDGERAGANQYRAAHGQAPYRRATYEMPERTARRIFRQIASAICFLHSRGVQHGDVKPENVMITSGLSVKVVDFGFSSRVRMSTFAPDAAAASFHEDKDDSTAGAAASPASGDDAVAAATRTAADEGASAVSYSSDEEGSGGSTPPTEHAEAGASVPSYFPPEMRPGSKYPVLPFAVDVWMTGNVLLFLTCLPYLPISMNGDRAHIHYPDCGLAEQIKASRVLRHRLGMMEEEVDGKRYSYEPRPDSFALRDLLLGMMDENPRKRLTMAQVLEHPWTQGTAMPDEAVEDLCLRCHDEGAGSHQIVPTRFGGEREDAFNTEDDIAAFQTAGADASILGFLRNIRDGRLRPSNDVLKTLMEASKRVTEDLSAVKVAATMQRAADAASSSRPHTGAEESKGSETLDGEASPALTDDRDPVSTSGGGPLAQLPTVDEGEVSSDGSRVTKARDTGAGSEDGSRERTPPTT